MADSRKRKASTSPPTRQRSNIILDSDDEDIQTLGTCRAGQQWYKTKINNSCQADHEKKGYCCYPLFECDVCFEEYSADMFVKCKRKRCRVHVCIECRSKLPVEACPFCRTPY